MNVDNLHISLFPAGGVDVASSRIRVYQMQSILAKLGVATTFGYSLKANVLLFQKRLTRENLWQARVAKAMGRLVIYDVDDLGAALWYYVREEHFREMLGIADVIVTCSDGQKNHLVTEYKASNVQVVPTSIDYFPSQPVKSRKADSNRLRIIWFGSSSNLHLVEKYIDTLCNVENSELVVVAGDHDIDLYRDKYSTKPIEFIPWSLCGFIQILQSCDLACLMHDGANEDLAKGNNKMIAAITWGVPAVVSRTPEYECTALEAGIDHAIFSNGDELLGAIARLRTGDARHNYLEVAQPSIWAKYSPETIVQLYLGIIMKAFAQQTDQRRISRLFR